MPLLQKRIEYTRQFIKQLKKAPPEINRAFKVRLAIFLNDDNSPILRNHSLMGEYKGYRSINVNGDWRALYSTQLDVEGAERVIFEVIGTHSQLYT